MKYKCHFCGENLKLGQRYTFECDCGNCNLGFDRHGELNRFHLVIFEKGKDLIFDKEMYSDAIIYGEGQGWNKPYMNKVILQVKVPVQFDENGMPLVYKLWEKLNKLIIFS